MVLNNGSNLVFILCVLALQWMGPVKGYRILTMPLSSKSHILAMTALSQELASRGHEVHLTLAATQKLSPDLASNNSKIIIQRFGSSDSNLDYDKLQDTITSKVVEQNAGMGDMFGLLKDYAEVETRQLLVDNDEFIKRLENIKFDIAIVDQLFFMKHQYLIPLRLGIPWVTYSDMLPFWNVRVPHLPSFVPSKMSSYSDRMSFFQRLVNVFCAFAPQIYAFPEPSEEILGKYRKYGEFNNMDDLVSRSQLFIVTSDLALDYATPTMPNVVEVGGMTLQKSSGKELPKDLEDFMYAGKDGVILVTFGSMISQLPKNYAEKFLEAFEKLNTYSIIWRFTNKDNLTIPRNVMLAKWLPQADILADPRLKLFITHSGNNGQFEAMYYSVPMIGFPVIGDQHFNAQRLRARGYGIPMSLQDFTAGELLENIQKIVKDDSYRRRIAKASEIFRSARESPGERAAYWIEHVVKFGGQHLRSAGNDLNFFQYFLLDVLFFISAVLTTLVTVIVLGVRYVYVRFFKKSDNAVTIHSKNGHAKKIN